MISHPFGNFFYGINVILTSLHVGLAYIHTDNSITPAVPTTVASPKLDFGAIEQTHFTIQPNLVKKDSYVFITCKYKYVNFSNKRLLANSSIVFSIGKVMQFGTQLGCTKTNWIQAPAPWYTIKVKCRATCQMNTNVLCTLKVGNKLASTRKTRLLVYSSLPVDTPKVFTDMCTAKDHSNCKPCINPSDNAETLTLKQGEELSLQCQTSLPVLRSWESEPVAKITWWRFFPNDSSVEMEIEYIFYDNDMHNIPPTNECINEKSPKIDAISVFFKVPYDHRKNLITVYCSITLNVTKKKTITKNSEKITICILPTGVPTTGQSSKIGKVAVAIFVTVGMLAVVCVIAVLVHRRRKKAPGVSTLPSSKLGPGVCTVASSKLAPAVSTVASSTIDPETTTYSDDQQS